MFGIEVIANTFLQYDFDFDRETITPLKLQKLIYLLHGYYLAREDQSVLREYFEAWKYGPVNSQLYHRLKHYGNKPITDYISSIDEDDPNELSVYVVSKKKSDFWPVFNEVVDKYMPMTAIQLSSLTHKNGSPWDITYSRLGEGWKIDDSLIKRHFKKQLALDE